MSDKTGIEWTDATWNPIRGCSRVSQGCIHCYAEGVARRFSGPGQPYAGLIDARTGGWNGTVRFIPEALDQPLRWKRPRRIFVNSMSDLFHENVSEDQVRAIFGIMAQARQHTFQVLTKRPERALELLTKWQAAGLTLREGCGVVLPNVWIGVSVENQDAADERVPLLLRTPSAVRFLSCEPLLGPVNLTDLEWGDSSVVPRDAWCDMDNDDSPPAVAVNALDGYRWQRFGDWSDQVAHIDWVICGGESGQKPRPMHPKWAQELRDQCAVARVPFFFKQWGAWTPVDLDRGEGIRDWFIVDIGGGVDIPDYRTPHEASGEVAMRKRHKKDAGRLLDGREYNEYPQVSQ